MDVFLELLMQDMKILWETGVKMLDDTAKNHSHREQLSLLRSMTTLLSLHYQDSSRESLVV